MDNIVKGRALIHEIKGLLHHCFEHLSHLIEHTTDSVLAANRQSVRREEKLGIARRHIPQGSGPLSRVALRFLGVAGIRKCPNEEISSTNRLVFRDPCPGVIVGLSPRMIQFNLQAAHRKHEVFTVGHVGARRCQW